MKEHQDIQRILASYRDASRDERAAVDAHLSECLLCAERLAAYLDVDAAVSQTAHPALPARLAMPFAAQGRMSPRPFRPGFSFAVGRRLAPLAVAMVLLAMLSVFVWSVTTTRAPVTSTPTLTTTLTPTTISARVTHPATFVAAALAAAQQGSSVSALLPTPAPAPAPSGRDATALFAVSGARARIVY